MAFIKKTGGKEKSAEDYYNEGKRLFDLAEYKNAIKMFDKSILLDKYNIDAYYDKINCLKKFGTHEHRNKIIEIYDEVINFENDTDFDTLDIAYFYYNKGFFLQELFMLEDAIEMYNKAISIDSDYINSYYEKGNCLYFLGRYCETLEMYEIYENASDFVSNYFYYEKGLCLDKLGRYEDAIEMYNKVIELEPNYNGVKELISECLEKIKK